MERITRDQIERFPLFSGLNEEQLEKIAKHARLKRFAARDSIIREGELGGELFLLLQGEIEISKRLTLYSKDGLDEKEKGLIRLNQSMNVFFGEMTLFDSAERSATVTALSEVMLGILTKEQLGHLAEADPMIGYRMFYNVARTLAGNLRKANRDILKLTTAFCMALERG